ncbi:hydantoinase B/oxoprolinase family protein [Massilia sp. B-10]|nr:hydantoinase B/oxoprolinase family protein [Massilia sp. B-10]
MPPDSVSIDQEGVLIDNFKLVDGANGLLRDQEAPPCWAGRSTRPAIPTRIWPTCAPRSPPTRRAWTNCARWSRTSAWPWSRRTWATCRTTPRKRCGA